MVAKPDVQQLNQYAYSPSALRYRDLKTGRFIKPEVVRAAVDHVIDAEALKIRTISQQLVDGQINLAEWQLQMSAQLKTLHVAMGLAASGGKNGASASDLGFIGSEIKKQYKFLRSFAKQIKNGQQRLNGSLVARSALYAQAARGTYEDVVRRSAKQANMQLERRKLGIADHCAICAKQASLSWQPIGTLKRIGDSPCKSNCHCTFEYKIA